MSNLSDFRAVLARVRNTPEASREMDAEVARLLGWKLATVNGTSTQFWESPNWWKPVEVFESLPHFTGSLNTVRALIERRLPGHCWTIGFVTKDLGGPHYQASVFDGVLPPTAVEGPDAIVVMLAGFLGASITHMEACNA